VQVQPELLQPVQVQVQPVQVQPELLQPVQVQVQPVQVQPVQVQPVQVQPELLLEPLHVVAAIPDHLR
jgi:hypothetical protein